VHHFSMTATLNPVWEKHGGLAWSNPAADDSVRLRAALVRPRFSRLLDLAVAFGLERLRAEWQFLAEVPTPEVERARPIVERILGKIEKGFRHAAAGD
jgi:hypothetical protein